METLKDIFVSLLSGIVKVAFVLRVVSFRFIDATKSQKTPPNVPKNKKLTLS